MSTPLSPLSDLADAIQSGRIRRTNQIRIRIRRAIGDAIEQALNAAYNTQRPPVDTGQTREGYEDSKQSVIYAAQQGNRITITSQDVLDAIVANPATPDWAKYHIRQHPEFNAKFAAGYKNPTTPGTYPINIAQMQVEFIRRLPGALRENLKKQGLDAT